MDGGYLPVMRIGKMSDNNIAIDITICGAIF